jgi:hypothetical protein
MAPGAAPPPTVMGMTTPSAPVHRYTSSEVILSVSCAKNNGADALAAPRMARKVGEGRAAAGDDEEGGEGKSGVMSRRRARAPVKVMLKATLTSGGTVAPM